MKAITYIKKIIKENACSIATAENLTRALHRENLLHPDLSIRFRVLFGDFDIVETAWLKGDRKKTFYVEIGAPENILFTASLATTEYTALSNH